MSPFADIRFRLPVRRRLSARAVACRHSSEITCPGGRVGGEERSGASTTGARFLPKWHDLCERTLGRQLEAAPDLERLQGLRGPALGFRGEPERLDRRSLTPRPEIPAEIGAGEARWAVETAWRVIAEFHAATGRELPDWL